MRDSDWSKKFLLRSDWLLPVVALLTTPSSSHDDTSSDYEEESTEYEGGSSGDGYLERSFQVLFIDNADIPEVV